MSKRKSLNETALLLSTIGKMKDMLHGRSVGLLVADGSDQDEVAAVQQAVSEAGATLKVVAPKLEGVTLAGGGRLAADSQLAGTPSGSFDAIAVILSEAGAEQLCGDAAALDFVMDAYCHLKTLGVDHGAQTLLQRAGVAPGAGVVDIHDSRGFIASAKARQWASEGSAHLLTR